MKGLVFLALLATSWPAVALAAPADPPATPDNGPATSATRAAPDTGAANPYGGHTDEELTALAAHWDSLDRHQRRALLTEMKLRMARKGERKSVIQIRTERRYGRIIRQSDGRVIHIETQVVHVRPVDPDELEARQSFGVGFEQRIGRRHPQDPASQTAQVNATAPADVPADGSAVPGEPSLNSVLESLSPSTQVPQVNRLPVYQVSDPKP